MKTSRLIPGILGVLLLCLPFVQSEEAEWEFRCTAQKPVEHHVNGFSQTVFRQENGLYRVHVSFSAMPVASRSQAPPLAPLSKVPASFSMPESLRRSLGSTNGAWERATDILRWVTRNLKLNSTDMNPQDAASVLRRGKGRCSGLANATAAIFMSAGYDARTVSGLLVGDHELIPHRWLEVKMPGAGWVPSDPTMGFWVVTPRHVVFDHIVEEIPSVTVLKAPGRISSFARLDGLPLRPDRGSNLSCRIIGKRQGELVAVIRNRQGEERRTLLDPEGVFSGLLPGRWLLELMQDRRVIRRMAIQVKAGQDNSVALKLETHGG